MMSGQRFLRPTEAVSDNEAASLHELVKGINLFRRFAPPSPKGEGREPPDHPKALPFRGGWRVSAGRGYVPFRGGWQPGGLTEEVVLPANFQFGITTEQFQSLKKA